MTRQPPAETEPGPGREEWFPPEALLGGYPEPIAALGEDLRRVVRRAVPEAVERVRVGWRVIGYDVLVDGRTSYFAWIMPEREHVHLGFPHGVLLDDPTGVLAGRGITKAARWFTLREAGDLDDARLDEFVRAAAVLARLARSRPSGRRMSTPEQRHANGATADG